MDHVIRFFEASTGQQHPEAFSPYIRVEDYVCVDGLWETGYNAGTACISGDTLVLISPQYPSGPKQDTLYFFQWRTGILIKVSYK